MNNKITIVTAFFPLERGKWKGFERSNDKYLQYFEYWSRLQNDMVIYTDPETAPYVEKIRKEKYNRSNTKIIIIDDWRKIDTEVYKSISKTMESELAKNYKINPNNPESWNKNYNYMTNIKPWFVQDAVKNKYVDGMIAWIDFGFNHDGDYYLKSEEFDFDWKYDFEDKITLFTINDIEDLPIFEICRRLNCYIQGNIMVAPDYLWLEFWKLTRQSIISLADIGLSDDDQTISLMAYRKNPEIFNLLPTKEWFSMLEEYGNQKFTIKPKEEIKFSKFKEFRRKLAHKKNIKRYLKYWYFQLKDNETKG